MYFLGGLIVPLSFLPGWLRNITDFLPFKYIYNYPAEILIKGINSGIMHDQFSLCLWMVVLLIISRVVFVTSQKYFTANGG